MKFKLKLPLPLALLTVAMGFSAVPMQAQFAVFDGASWTELGSIWSQDVSNGVKLTQTVQQGGMLISQGLSIYNLAMRETTALRNKQWMQAAGYLSHMTIPGQPQWTLALRSGGGMLNAAGAWQQMTAPGASLQNRIQIADAFGTSMADALGGCTAAAIQSDGAIGQLEQIALSMNTLDNTRASLGRATTWASPSNSESSSVNTRFSSNRLRRKCFSSCGKGIMKTRNSPHTRKSMPLRLQTPEVSRTLAH